MSLLNVNLNVLSYEDEPASTNPNVRTHDTRFSMLGIPTTTPRTERVNLSPGESQTIMTTSRTLSYNGATSFQITQVAGTTHARLNGTYGQRTARTYGDATTQWAITKTTNLITMTYTGTGTAPNFGTMVAGDGVTLGAAFNPQNQGDFVIVKVGVNFIDFVNPLGVAETVTGLAQIYSAGPVQIGDMLDIVSTQFVHPNRGQFQITRVTDTFVEFSNPNAVPETVTGVTSGLTIYSEAYKWMLAAVDGRVIVKLNEDTGNSVEIEPAVTGDIVKNPGLMLKRGKVYQVVMQNPGLYKVTGFVFLAQ